MFTQKVLLNHQVIISLQRDTFGAIADGVTEEYYNGFGKIDAEKILKSYLDEELYALL